MFYIKKIVITGTGVEPAVVEFDKGLNIVYGESNTGKSYIAECIDYMFGAKDIRISPDTKYDKITMSVDVDGRTMTMEREFGSTNIEVNGAPPDIDNGTYKRGRGKMSIGDVWLKIMGIPDGQKIIKGANYQTQQLTLRTFRHLFYIDENDVDKENSIILSERGFADTAAKTALLYLATGDNYLDDHESNDPKVRKGKKEALENFVAIRLKSLGDRQKELVDSSPELTPVELEKKISEVIEEIESIESLLSNETARSRKLSSRIFELNDEIAENEVLLNRYNALMTQYKADIKRLNFIAEGDAHTGDIPENLRCPFCDGELSKAAEESCAAAAYAEVEKILPQITDLEEALEELKAELEAQIKEREDSIAERSELLSHIRSDLRPRIKLLREDLGQYTLSLQNYNEQDVIRKVAKELQEEYEKYTKEIIEAKETFNVDAHYEDAFRSTFAEVLSGFLTRFQFDPFNVVDFDLSTYDVVIDGHPKKSYGQGYRAFLNVVMALSLQEYLENKGVYHPGILVIDSPILSLKERGDDKKTSDGMKVSLFKYLTENQKGHQTIIIENRIPESVNYDNVKLIHFTKDLNEGRYGLLDGVK